MGLNFEHTQLILKHTQHYMQIDMKKKLPIKKIYMRKLRPFRCETQKNYYLVFFMFASQLYFYVLGPSNLLGY